MFTLHCTAKLRDRLKRPLRTQRLPATTVLGDWYATALFWKPQFVLLVGTAGGVLAHPLMWFLALILAHTMGWRGSLGDPTASPPQALAAIPAHTFLSWLLVCWLTAPVGALTGGLIAFLHRRRAR